MGGRRSLKAQGIAFLHVFFFSFLFFWVGPVLDNTDVLFLYFRELLSNHSKRGFIANFGTCINRYWQFPGLERSCCLGGVAQFFLVSTRARGVLCSPCSGVFDFRRRWASTCGRVYTEVRYQV